MLSNNRMLPETEIYSSCIISKFSGSKYIGYENKLHMLVFRLKAHFVTFKEFYWPKLKKIFIIMFSVVYKYLKITIIMFMLA